MKYLKKSSLLAMLFLLVAACSSDDEPIFQDDALELPPFETMMADFDAFTDNAGSGKYEVSFLDKAPKSNWNLARVVIGTWNVTLFTTLAVPITSFRTAFLHDPERIGEDSWQWMYTVDGFGGEYTARLTGELVEDVIVWEMYVSRSGIEAFGEFLWFTGESASDGSSGHWILNQGPDRQNAMLRIDWVREMEEVGTIRYTWVREFADDQSADPYRNSYLEYGLIEGDYDAYFDAHVYEANLQDFVDVRIEWNRDLYFGRIQAPHFYEDMEWRCWDGTGEDVLCE